MNTASVWHFIVKKLAEDIPVALMLVPQSVGSSPGRQGHMMAVAADGTLCGTIGGGAMEYIQVESCKKTLVLRPQEVLFQRLVHEKRSDTDWSGLSCSGEQIVLRYYLYSEDIELIEQIIELSVKGHWTIRCSVDNRLECVEVNKDFEKFFFKYHNDSDWIYQFRIKQIDRVFLVGAGHVGQALCRQLYFLDFEIILIDNRKDLPTDSIDAFIHQKIICNYKNVANFVSSGKHDYIVIMSFSSSLDQLILSQLIHLPSKYIGMMASKTKAERIRKNLLDQAVKEADLDKVHTPIGVSIACKTPAEIAVSVAAQMIQVRNKEV